MTGRLVPGWNTTHACGQEIIKHWKLKLYIPESANLLNILVPLLHRTRTHSLPRITRFLHQLFNCRLILIAKNRGNKTIIYIHNSLATYQDVGTGIDTDSLV